MLRVRLAASLLTWSFTFFLEDAQTYIFECIYLEYAYEVDILIFIFFFLNDYIVHVYVLLQINSESDEIQRFK